jgi:molybdenum cofactor cytidylyltransferase
MVAAIILAAGASERMGFPKALLSYRGRSFLAGILDACAASGVEPCVVVLGYYASKIRESVDLSRAVVVESENLPAGPIGSIRAGIKALEPHPVKGILIWPVDRPHVPVNAVTALLDAFLRTGGPIVLPVFRGRRGHPVIFGRILFDELVSAPDGEGARAVVHRDPTRVVEVSASDAAVLEDLNTPDDYKALLRREDQIRGE